MSDPKRRPESDDPEGWDEPVFGEDNDEKDAESYVDEPYFDDPYHDEPHFDEPVFSAADYDDEEDEPTFAAAPYPPQSGSASNDDDDEFDYVPDPRVAESLAVGASAGGSNMLSRQSRRSAAERADAEGDSSNSTGGRRLGRTGPFWLMGAGAVIVILLIVLLFLLRGNGEDVAGVDTVTPAASGELGSVTFPQTQSVTVTAVIEPTATALPIFDVGQRVVVSNTSGQGIRLRNQPNTGALTLDIFQDGDAFTILNPDGDYTDYPVEADGYRWYRIQVADSPGENLTGWAAADFLQAE